MTERPEILQDDTRQTIKDIEKLHGALLSAIDDKVGGILRLCGVMFAVWTVLAVIVLVLERVNS